MATRGYEYFESHQLPSDWAQLVADAEKTVSAGLDAKKGALEAINSERLQLRFPRSDALPLPLRRCVDTLKQQLVETCGDEFAEYQLQDCYALLTPKEELGGEARAPQRWHLDAIKRFPVAALLLRGARATEFSSGDYSDFAAGVSERTLDAWTASLKHINARTWEAESIEEWEHFGRHLHAAGLVTGVDAEDGELECDWAKLEIAPTPEAKPGSAAIFWSNKVHRGPATEPGEERLVLFCSWLPPGAYLRQTTTKESETDYSYYDGHLEPKLRLSVSAARSYKRQRSSRR